MSDSPDQTGLDQKGLDRLFYEGRSYNSWRDKPVDGALLHALYDLMRMPPTSANCSPARVVFVRSAEAKAKLLPCMLPTNRQKTETAPVCAIIAHDLQFYDLIPQLFPHNPAARDWFSGDAAVAEATAFRNGTLQGGYFMLAARALGLDVGPMSGFDNAAVDAAFFPGGRFKSNFLCNIGYGDASDLFDRSPRLSFDEACRIV